MRLSNITKNTDFLVSAPGNGEGDFPNTMRNFFVNMCGKKNEEVVINDELVSEDTIRFDDSLTIVDFPTLSVDADGDVRYIVFWLRNLDEYDIEDMELSHLDPESNDSYTSFDEVRKTVGDYFGIDTTNLDFTDRYNGVTFYAEDVYVIDVDPAKTKAEEAERKAAEAAAEAERRAAMSELVTRFEADDDTLTDAELELVEAEYEERRLDAVKAEVAALELDFEELFRIAA